MTFGGPNSRPGEIDPYVVVPGSLAEVYATIHKEFIVPYIIQGDY